MQTSLYIFIGSGCNQYVISIMTLETKRMILRLWQESDAESLYKYAKDQRIGPVAGWQTHTSIENSSEIIKQVLSAPNVFAVEHKELGEAIGSVGIITPTIEYYSSIDPKVECEVGYWIGYPFWGQGLIPEALNEVLRYAFEELHYAVVWAGYYDGNDNSKRVLEKCGFSYSHTEHNKYVPLMDEYRTEHYAKIVNRRHK